MLYITFMGGPRFLLDGADVSDQISSKAAAIIALVLMKATQQMRRSDIISYLWSESSDDAAKYNLRFNLWQIKKALVQADGELASAGVQGCYQSQSQLQLPVRYI